MRVPQTSTVEADLHRVLQLARADKKTACPATVEGDKRTRRHRHTALTATVRPISLVHARLRSVSALDGIAVTTAKLGDTSIRMHRQGEKPPRRANVEGIKGVKKKDCNNHQSRKNDIVAGQVELSKEQDDDPCEERRRELLAARQRIYRNHFSGLSTSTSIHTSRCRPRPSLEILIDAAMDAKRACSRHMAVRVGAAILTSRHHIFAASRLESMQDNRLDMCAERGALLKLLASSNSDDNNQVDEVVEAMVICSDQRDGAFPLPCGSCRELLADGGDFPVYLLNGELDTHETRSFELFPLARCAGSCGSASSSSAAATATFATDPARQSVSAHTQIPHSKADRNQRPSISVDDVRSWTPADVAHWMTDTVQLPAYSACIESKRVDGALLLQLTDPDLQLLMGVVHPLHRRRILLHIDRLRDHELLSHGLDMEQLHDYLAVLDSDRLEVVAQLKTTFDRLDRDRDGRVDRSDLRHALTQTPRSTSHNQDPEACDATGGRAVLEAMEKQALSAPDGCAALTFPAFVQAFASLAMHSVSDDAGCASSHANHGAIPMNVDLVGLKTTFQKVDTNQSGSLDEGELIALFRSLGRAHDEALETARQWFTAADLDGDSRLSFAEFVLRYTQRTRVETTRLRSVFDSAAPQGSEVKPISILPRVLHKLFPSVDAAQVTAWCQTQPWTTCMAVHSKPATVTTIAFADFLLACLLFRDAQESLLHELRGLQERLRNDPRCHWSRIVYLQRSGHVRLCRRRYEGGDMSTDTAFAPVAARRREANAQALGQTTKVRPRRQTKMATEEESPSDPARTETQDVDAVFARFCGQPAWSIPRGSRQRRRRRDEQERKGEDSGSEGESGSESEQEKEEEEAKRGLSDQDAAEKEHEPSARAKARTRLSAVEAAQALIELGLACSREQLLRFLQREGHGVARTIERMTFHRLYAKLRVFREHPHGSTANSNNNKDNVNDDDRDQHMSQRWRELGFARAPSVCPAQEQHMWELMRENTYGKHKDRDGYDAYLRGKQHQLSQQRILAERSAVLRQRQENSADKQRDRQLARIERERRHQARHRREEQDRKGESSDDDGHDEEQQEEEEAAQGHKHLARQRRRSRARSSTRTDRRRRRSHRRKPRRSRSRHANRVRDRRRRSGSVSSSSSSSSSWSGHTSPTSASTTSLSSEEEGHRHRRCRDGRVVTQDIDRSHQSMHRRGLEVGDRVTVTNANAPRPHHHHQLNVNESEERTSTTGTVVRLYRDYFVADVRLDNGTTARNVDLTALRRIQLPRPGDAQAPQQRLTVGVAVTVSHKGTQTTRRAVVMRCHSNGACDVEIREQGQPRELLRRVPRSLLQPVLHRVRPQTYAEQAPVTVKRRHEYARGRVARAHADGTYDVALRRGEKNKQEQLLARVTWELLAPDSDMEATSSEDERDGNARRERQGHGREQADSTDQEADDRQCHGGRKRSHAREEEKAEEDTYDEDAFDDEESGLLNKGDRVEARFQAQSAFYSGSIVRVFTNDTYDIAYDDGDSETRVPRRLIRVLQQPPTMSPAEVKARGSANGRQKQIDSDVTDYEDEGFESG